MPVTPTYPGVYIEELPSRVRTITAVSTSVTAFVGYTAKGPVDQPVTITGFADFERRFGGLAAKSPVSYAVQQFFLNGGSIGVVVRVASGSATASSTLKNSSDPSQSPGDALVVAAKEPGAWGNALRISVDYATPTPNDTFTLRVGNETFNDLSPDPDHPRYVVDVVNSGSALIEISSPGGDGPVLRPDPNGTVSGPFGTDVPAIPDKDLEVKVQGGTETYKTRIAGQPANVVELGLALEKALRAIPDKPRSRTFGAARVTPMGNRLQVVSGSDDPTTVLEFSGEVATALNLNASPNTTAYAVGATQQGTDGDLPGPNDIIGSELDKTGIHALRDVEDVNLLCLPEVCGFDSIDQQVQVLAAAERLCADKRMFLLVDSPATWTTLDRARAGLTELDPVRSDHAALYFPHLEQTDPLTGRLRAFPPCGTVAGIMARTDSERGVWKAPAGTEARLAGARALTVPLNDPENGLVNPLGVNCLRSFPVIGPVVWGARTLDGADSPPSQWKYVPVRRLALMIEESLYRGTKWVVFEPNDEPLWAQIRLNVGAFMNSLFERGAFQGTSSREAYFVKCDKDTTTQNDINSGIVNILVGFAPLKPAEFVIIQIEQLAGQIEV
ncbi:phage tail sheath C-terminal domain-containing protein [Saccharothrix luteola]|uniref:phage tail sheath C-terminal domain-containing protein n=1 Tax=Saccharothrix luteola TaxID=2893018 RepID=UPI001E5BC85C|nr:phage tail sheath C-terminal domain-containing protein [Saccharothrix luteola]MCC8250485.1 phage tail sheath subtilisin-like domain-containing protein [Saccharothrix luteola]